jgi:hypothetical protein
MNTPSTSTGLEADRLPTLTEVVQLDVQALAIPEPPPVLVDVVPEIDAQALIDDVMHTLQHRIDLMFEYRLREAVAPALARVAEAIIEDTRIALATTLREMVERAVAQEVARRRPR